MGNEILSNKTRQSQTNNITDLEKEVALLKAELKQTRKELRETNRNAENVLRIKSEFLASVSHEIRTPLNAILGFSQWLYENTTDSQHREYLTTILHSARDLLNLLNDILDLSKIESGKLDIDIHPMNYQEVINDIRQVFQQKVEEFAPFRLTTDLSVLTEKEKQMLPLLLEAAQIMDDIFWTQAYGDKNELFTEDLDEYTKKFLKINYGPWERLNNNQPFIEGVGPKPAGANFYPTDMTKEEFDAWDEPTKASLYTVIRRDKNGNLVSVPYHEAWKGQVTRASELLLQAAELAEDSGLKNYLEKRARALLTDQYYESDMAWMDMKNNTIEFIVGPIENYEDQLYGYKTAHESFILIKDKEWSEKLEKYAAFLPGLQKALPCESPYKNETPGIDSDMNVYDA
ncbi:MAG: histidine kinase dimerization/phospho-acceptor domain-containing protein, partial [Mariniphaga sp.]